MAAGSLEERLRGVLAARPMLGHPFYQEWVAGTLGRARMREFARQFYHFEAAFPRFLSALHARTDSPRIRQVLLENLWDEEHGDRNHPVLWLQFASALRLGRSEVERARLLPGTQALIGHFAEVARSAPLAEGLATLFAFEGQVPELAWQAIKALSEHYGLRPEQFEFFSVHLVADVAHSGAEMEAINLACEDEGAVEAATVRACDLLLAFLDGCMATKEAA